MRILTQERLLYIIFQLRLRLRLQGLTDLESFFPFSPQHKVEAGEHEAHTAQAAPTESAIRACD